MENNAEKTLNSFIDEEPKVDEKKNKHAKKVILDEREGLIERVDKVFITEDGRQLLREWY